MTHVARGAGGEGRDRQIREIRAQRAQLAVFRAEFVSPFGDAMCLVDGEEGDRNSLEPGNGVRLRQALGRKIQQTIRAGGSVSHDARLSGRHRAVERGRGNTHLEKLRDLILHERDERRNDDRGFSEQRSGQLVAERLAATGGHDHAGIFSGEQAAHDLFLQGQEGVISPVAFEESQETGRENSRSNHSDGNGLVL